MSVETDERGAAGPAEPDHEAHQHAHPSDRNYIVVAVLLAAITALEVGTYFLEDPSTTLLVVALFPLMIAKFAVVCGWFMHLRYDNPLFKRVFVFGLSLAIGVYIIVLTSMQFWDSGYGT
ncbi:MAG TPA: cytochrome C oxidase subunit IV family protein [Acidimicrobiales bacterium]|nr:cytochrome C oxidase subunit IV family protein [Acidimicrobiales bacterium]